MTAARPWGKYARRAGWGLLALVGGLVLLVGVALGVLHTGFGGERVRRFVLPKVNQAIVGQLEVGKLAVHGAGLELFDVVLRDPEGGVVATVGRLDVALGLRGLLDDRIDISHVEIERPRFHLVQSARGLNLTRAVAARVPSPEEPSSPSTLQIVLRRLQVTGGALDFRDVRPGGPPAVALSGLGIEGNGQVALADQTFEGDLKLNARTAQPLAAPLALALKGAGQGAAGKANVDLRIDWGATGLAARAVSKDTATQEVTIERLSVAPAAVAVFAPTVPLAAAVTGKGQVRRAGDNVEAALTFAAAGTRLALDTDVDTARLVARKLRLEAKSVDLARLIEGGPPSRFDVLIVGKGGGRSLERLAGEVDVSVPRGQIDGRALGPVRVQASAAEGRYTLTTLEAALPGLRLTGSGRADAKTVGLGARLQARDLALTSRSLRLPKSLGLAGSGELNVTLGGSPAVPSLVVSGKLPRLRGAGQDLTGVTFTGRVADLRRAPARSQVQLSVSRLRLGAQTVQDLSLALAGDPAERVQVRLAARGPMPITVDAAGKVSRAAELIALERLSIVYPQATWQMTTPAQIAYGDELAVRGLELRAGPDQRIALDLSQTKRKLSARASVDRFDLARLPPVLLPKDMVLAGRLDVTAALAGSPARPDADVTVGLSGGKVQKLRDLGLRLEAHHKRGRLTGTLAARALAADHQARFDVPATWPPPPEAVVSLEAKLGEVGLAEVGQLLGKKLGGRAAVTFSVEGLARDPSLTVRALGSNLELGGERVEALSLTVDDPTGKPLGLALEARVLGRPNRVTLTTPVVLGRWLRRPPDRDELLAAPFAAKLDAADFPLSALGGPRPGAPTFTGTISASAALTGPVERLHGNLAVTAKQVTGPRLPPTNATLQARLGEGRDGLDARLLVNRRGRNIGDLTAALGVGIDDLLARRSLATVPVRLRGTVGPLGLQRLVAGAAYGMRNTRMLRGLIESRVNLEGTLGQPRLDLRMGVRNANLAGQPLGQAALLLTYAEAHPRLLLELNTVNGGKLKLEGDARVDLGLPALQRGIQARAIPLQSKLTAQDLNLTFLSALHDEVRTVAGKLSADATVSGVLGAPQVAGKVSWKEGRLVTASYGELRDLGLELRGDNKEMVLDKLFARSGRGSANVTGKAIRQANDRLQLEARANLDRFHLQTEGQPIGALSLKGGARGTVAPDKIEIATKIEEARIELEGKERRRLQSLKRPTDIVLLENGEPIDRKNAQRLVALEERQRQRADERASGTVVKGPVPGPLPATAPAAPQPPQAPKPTAAADVRPTRISVSAPRNIWVRGPDANLELGLDPDFLVVDSDELRVFGTVRVRRGFVEVLGRRFNLSDGSTVVFTGPPDRPTLAVDAQYKVERADSETTVVVHVEGPATALSFSLRSPEHPEYGDTELMSLIATGRLPEDSSNGGTAAGTQAASVLGGLIADKVQKTLMSRLPIDVLTIEPGGEGLSGARLEAGTYIGDKIYVAYVGHLGAEVTSERDNRNEVHLEYQLTSRWSFEATYGDALQGSFDLLWTRNY